MSGIQGAINSMISSGSRAVMAVKGYQALQARHLTAPAAPQATQPVKARKTAAKASIQEQMATRAKQSAADAKQAKAKQRRSFKEYLAKQPSSLGQIGDLDPKLQALIAKSFSKTRHRQLMDIMDKEAGNGKHKQRNSPT